jgi:hypothetical protein
MSIKFGNQGYELLCPACGGDYLHHEQVTTYDRNKEDAEQVELTRIGPGREIFHTVASSKATNNPSARRDGIAILFSCEGCERWSELTIAQHKGQTLCGWRKGQRLD